MRSQAQTTGAAEKAIVLLRPCLTEMAPPAKDPQAVPNILHVAEIEDYYGLNLIQGWYLCISAYAKFGFT